MAEDSSRLGQIELFGGGEKTRARRPRLTRSKREALRLLAEKRKTLLREARRIAYQIGEREEGITTQDLLAEMIRRSLLSEDDLSTDQRFIGAIFSRKDFREDFEPIGFRIQANPRRNCHSAARRVWRLKDRGKA